MNGLFAAITTKFKTTNDLNTALSGRMYPFEAKQGTDFPYGVYYLVSDFTDLNFSDEQEHAAIQFSLFSEEASIGEIGELYTKLTALFDDEILTVSGYTMLQFKRTGSRIIRDEEYATWHYVVEYDVLLEKQR